MRLKDCKVGMRVKVNSTYDGSRGLIGKEGTIKKVSARYIFVKLDKNTIGNWWNASKFDIAIGSTVDLKGIYKMTLEKLLTRANSDVQTLNELKDELMQALVLSPDLIQNTESLLERSKETRRQIKEILDAN